MLDECAVIWFVSLTLHSRAVNPADLLLTESKAHVLVMSSAAGYLGSSMVGQTATPVSPLPRMIAEAYEWSRYNPVNQGNTNWQ